MSYFYTIGIVLYSWMIRLAAPFNEKAKLWIEGRRHLMTQIAKDFEEEQEQPIWVHSASLGEFEQGRPLIEKLKKEYPEKRIVLTFFSPSGYEIRKNYDLADYVYYLPIDTPKNAREFLSLVKPKLAVFIKYEFWFHYLSEMHKRQIPHFIISAIFRPNQHFFKKTAGWQQAHLRNINHFFVQNEESKKLLNGIGIDQVSLSGDTRFDRVTAIKSQLVSNDLVKAFKNDKPLFLAGSSWPKDEQAVRELSTQYPDLKILIAPHLIDEGHIQEVLKLFPKAIRYTKAQHKNLMNHQVMVIDTMGMLSSLYQYADYALIGGGFGAGIHNTLEAASFGMPIFIGPHYQKFQEAKDLLSLGVIQVFETPKQLSAQFDIIHHNTGLYKEVVEKSCHYVQSKSGATQIIFDRINIFL